MTDSHLKDYYLRGVMPIIAASVLWGFSYMFMKLAVADASALIAAGVTTILQALLLWIIYRFTLRELIAAFRIAPWHFLWLSFFSILIGRVLSLYAMNLLDLGVVTILEKLQTVFVPIFASLVLKEKFPLRKIPYALLALMSAYFVVLKDPSGLAMPGEQFYGMIIMTCSALAYASTGVVGKLIVNRGASSRHISFFRFSLCTPMLFITPLVFPGIDLRMELTPGFIAAVSACAGGGVLAFLLYYKAYRHVEAGTAIFLELFTPVVGVILGILVFGETLIWSQCLAIPILIFSVYKIGKRQAPPL